MIAARHPSPEKLNAMLAISIGFTQLEPHERLAVFDSLAEMYCDRCGDLARDCGHRRCPTCGHHDRLACRCDPVERRQKVLHLARLRQMDVETGEGI